MDTNRPEFVSLLAAAIWWRDYATNLSEGRAEFPESPYPALYEFTPYPPQGVGSHGAAEEALVTGAELIAVERLRQVEAEDWTAEHDDGHSTGDLAQAAAAYATNDARLWPWPGEESWKPGADPLRRMAKAGALIAAEIDRLLRVKALSDG